MTEYQRAPRWLFHIRQMRIALRKIQSYLSGYTRDDFLSDPKTIDAIIRNLEILGEACHHVPHRARNHYPQVMWQELRHFRNLLAHEYFAIDSEMIWETATKDLVHMDQVLETIIEQNQ